MFELNPTGFHCGSSCESTYSVILDENCTVDDFIRDVLSRTDEWGRIQLDNQESIIFCQPLCLLKYKHGKLLSEPPAELRNKTIISAKARGGWSSMSYQIQINHTI